MMAPVMVWVVDTGMPSWVAMKMASEPPVSAQKPPNGTQLGEPHAHGLHDPPTTRHGAEAHGSVARQNDPQRKLGAGGKGLAQHPLRVEQHGDDSHGLLGIVAAMVEAEGRGRQKLQATKPLVDPARRLSAQQPGASNHQTEAPR
jgi:hypothetical protein